MGKWRNKTDMHCAATARFGHRRGACEGGCLRLQITNHTSVTGGWCRAEYNRLQHACDRQYSLYHPGLGADCWCKVQYVQCPHRCAGTRQQFMHQCPSSSCAPSLAMAVSGLHKQVQPAADTDAAGLSSTTTAILPRSLNGHRTESPAHRNPARDNITRQSLKLTVEGMSRPFWKCCSPCIRLSDGISLTPMWPLFSTAATELQSR
jgi:hypothetical protein